MRLRLTRVLFFVAFTAAGFAFVTDGASKATSLPDHKCHPNACAGTMAGWDDSAPAIPPLEVDCIINPGQPAFNNCQFDPQNPGCVDAPGGMVDCHGTWVVSQFPLQTKKCLARFVTCNPADNPGDPVSE